MDFNSFEKALLESEIVFLKDEPLKNHTSFKIGGNASFFLKPKNVEEMIKIRELLEKYEIRNFVFGKGSNILAPDEGYLGAIICLGEEFSKLTQRGNEIIAKSGALLSKLCLFAKDNGLKGLEFAYGIPGTVGGGAFMNAGAYGGEMKDVIKSVKVLDKDNKNITLSNKECEFAYRSSIFQKEPYIIHEVTFALSSGEESEIGTKMEEILQKRRDKQPLNYPSAGSTFKRPPDAYAAAIIDECGLKGFSVGGAAVSEKHAGFVINKNNATARDVKYLCDKIKQVVYLQKGIELETEIRIL